MMKSNTLYYVALALMVINVLGYVSVGSVECIIVFANRNLTFEFSTVMLWAVACG